MKRTKKVEPVTPELKDTDMIWWKNTGGGSLRLGRKIVKPGEKFQASSKAISLNFRDVIKPLDGVVPVKGQPPVSGKKPVFKAKPTEGVKGIFNVKPHEDKEGYYDVVSVKTIEKDGKKQISEKPLNAKPLTKAKAEALLNALQG